MRGSWSIYNRYFIGYPINQCQTSTGTVTPNSPVTVQPCAVPVNFRRTLVRKETNGILYFQYAWDSSTGNLADLSNCVVGEIVNYPNGADPYVWPHPPWDEDSPNPTVINVPGSDGGLGDNHRPGVFFQPYFQASFTATQYYRYRCPCSNNNQYVNLLGPISIGRSVSSNGSGGWMYTITKSGESHSLNPL